MHIFGDLFGGNEKLFEGSKGINKDFGLCQRDLQFLIFEKKSFWILNIFFNIGTPPPPKMTKTFEGQ